MSADGRSIKTRTQKTSTRDSPCPRSKSPALLNHKVAVAIGISCSSIPPSHRSIQHGSRQRAISLLAQDVTPNGGTKGARLLLSSNIFLGSFVSRYQASSASNASGFAESQRTHLVGVAVVVSEVSETRLQIWAKVVDWRGEGIFSVVDWVPKKVGTLAHKTAKNGDCLPCAEP